MPPIRHILFPVDFSAQTTLAAPYVRAMAGQFQAAVTALAVATPYWDVTSGEIPVVVQSGTAERKAELAGKIESAFRENWDGIRISRVVTDGDPAETILDFARKNAVDLIMMPTYGLGVFRRLLIGSVTAKVLHDSLCPVWTAAHSAEQLAPTIPGVVVCGVDEPSEEALVLVRWASEFADRTGASLSLIHVTPLAGGWIAVPPDPALQQRIRDEAHERLSAFLRDAAGVTAPLRVVSGDVIETLAEEARLEGAGLIVTGRASAQSLTTRLRSHVYGIVQQAPCPVLTL